MNKSVQKINLKTEKVKQTKFKKTMFCKLQIYRCLTKIYKNQ